MPETASSTRFVNVVEIAKLTGFCTRTVQDFYRSQGMPHIKAGRAVRFDPEKVTAWLESKYGQNCNQ